MRRPPGISPAPPTSSLSRSMPDGSGTALKWEPSRGGALFPHVYGDLPLAAVQWVEPLPLGPDRQHRFPPL